MSLIIDLESEMLLLTLKLYNNPALPRNAVQIFVESLINFTNITFRAYLNQQINAASIKVDKKFLDQIKSIFDASNVIFGKFSTEYQRFSLYQKKNLMIQPMECEIGSRFVNKVTNGVMTLEREKVFIEYIPLKWTLKLLLELPGVFHLLKSYMDELYMESDIQSNFIQGKLWKEMSKKFEKGKFFIPLFLYFDEFETGNALGSHAGNQKLGAVYTQIPCFPPYISSRLDSILLTALFYATDLKTFGNVVFKKVLSELNELKDDGLVLKIDKQELEVHFQLALVVGDNLGLNEMLGFGTQFNSGNPCRSCTATIEQINNLTKEDKDLLRTEQSYDEAINKKEFSETGIVERCVFNQVSGFHVCQNKVLDIMHDILEGTANYTLVNILNDLIYEQQLFSLEFLNERIQCFQYSSIEISNKIPEIKRDHIKVKQKLKMSASEMLNFTRYFSLLVGDKVKENNTVWSLYILLRKIIAFVTSPRMVVGHIYQLEILIPQFLFLYKSLYGPLKYKFHNMTHIVSTILSNGPAVHYWSMRFEAKHKEQKVSSVVSCNKKNNLKTVSIRSLLKLAYLKAANHDNFKDDKFIYQNCGNIDDRNRRMYFSDSNPTDKIILTEHIHVKGVDYKVNMVFVVEMGDNDLLKFGKITKIFVKEESIYLLMQPLLSLSFNEHLYAYNVKARDILILKNVLELPDVHHCLLVEKGNLLFVSTKYIL